MNILLDVVADQSGKQYKMDHYATRFPTNVLDIADFLVRLTSACSSVIFGPTLTSQFVDVAPTRAIPPILHYSAAEPFTKYEMCLVFAKILGVPHGHIIPDAEPPKVGMIPGLILGPCSLKTCVGWNSPTAEHAAVCA